jgi:hypothetical protein
LSHSLRFSRQSDEYLDKKNTSTSVYFNNNAALYRGVTLSLAVGQTESNTSEGQGSKSTTITTGSTLVPYRTMTINLYYNEIRSTTTGTGGQGAGFGSTAQSGTASVSYTPFQALYLYASYAVSETAYDNGGRVNLSRTQNYVLSWSPAFTGSLWLTVAATQTITSQDQGEINTLTPALRWQANKYMTFDTGYTFTTTRNIAVKAKTETIFATLRVML